MINTTKIVPDFTVQNRLEVIKEELKENDVRYKRCWIDNTNVWIQHTKKGHARYIDGLNFLHCFDQYFWRKYWIKKLNNEYVERCSRR